MLKSLYSGVSGMKGFQTKLDVIGNNIANVNTVGFKKGRVMFQDLLSQNLSGATAPDDTIPQGGVNPRQVGLGVQMGAIDTVHTAGSPMTTGVTTDLSIRGDGFFLVSPDPANGQIFLTRAGNFTFDADGNLVNSQGLFVLDTAENIINFADFENVVNVDISQNGVIEVTYNDDTTDSSTLGIAYVANPGGLRKEGSSLYSMTPNAHPGGNYYLGDLTGDDAGRSQVISGELEMSNVDLTEEFTEMIVAQRGFQSNSRIITTSDEILQEVVNLKR